MNHSEEPQLAPQEEVKDSTGETNVHWADDEEILDYNSEHRWHQSECDRNISYGTDNYFIAEIVCNTVWSMRVWDYCLYRYQYLGEITPSVACVTRGVTPPCQIIFVPLSSVNVAAMTGVKNNGNMKKIYHRFNWTEAREYNRLSSDSKIKWVE